MKPAIIIYFILLPVFLLAQLNDDSRLQIQYETTLQYTGDAVQVGLPIFALALSFKKKDREGMKQLAYGFTSNFVMTHLLKKITKKKRPESSTAYNAFPSGHTSTAFHAAAFLYKRYGWKYGIPCVALASIVGYSRIEGIDDRHDFLDVLGGAILGTASAFLFTTKFTRGITINLVPSDAQVAIEYTVRF